MHLRLERITADCVAPMEAEPSIEADLPANKRGSRTARLARPKRARGSSTRNGSEWQKLGDLLDGA